MELLPKVSDSEVFLVDPIVHLSKPHRDSRGAIQPLADEDMKSAVLISSQKGSVRANHYHKSDWHYCYLLNGLMDYYHRPVGDHNPPRCVRIKPGVLFFTPPLVEHAMVFLEDSTFVCLGRHSREQASYEADVVRVQLVAATEIDQLIANGDRYAATDDHRSVEW